MTDRELLELAAKAAGLKFATKPEDGDELGRIYEEHLGIWIWHFPDWWSPLTDDGDALWLAVKLRLKIEQHYYDGVYYCRVVWDGLAPPVVEPHSTDPYAATRRAIVRAAAEIGMNMK